MTASRKWQVGAARLNPKGRPLDGVYNETYCTFRIASRNAGNLPEAIRESVTALRLHSDLLRELIESGGRLEYFIGWFFAGNSGDIFDLALMAALAELGISLNFDIYVEDEEDEHPAGTQNSFNRKSPPGEPAGFSFVPAVPARASAHSSV